MILHNSGLIKPWMTFEAILHFLKDLCVHNVDVFEKVLKDFGVKQKTACRKR